MAGERLDLEISCSYAVEMERWSPGSLVDFIKTGKNPDGIRSRERRINV
jgi:hypothetical protein